MSNKYYIIGEIEYEYNDEIYCRTGEGILPVEAYHSKEKAQTKLVALEREYLERCGIEGRVYNWEEVFKEQYFFRVLCEKYLNIEYVSVSSKISSIDELEEMLNTILDKATDQEVLELLDSMWIRYHELVDE